MDEILVTSNLGSIDINYEELKVALECVIVDYKTAIYADDSIKQAKADRAYLRKQADEIDKKRKAAKKEFIKPYEEFEAKCKSLIALIDEGTSNIDSQVKDYEERKRKVRRVEIESLYKEIFYLDLEAIKYKLINIVPLERIYKKTWENATTTLKSVREDMVAIQSECVSALHTIANSPISPADKDEAVKVYKDTLSLAQAIAKVQEIQAVRARVLEEERARQEAEKIAQARAEEEAKWTAMNPPVPEVIESIAQEPVMDTESLDGAWVVNSITYKVTGSDEDYRALEEYMTERGMVWERI